MAPLELDLTNAAPNPTYEVAYRRILWLLKDRKKWVDAWVVSSPARLASNVLVQGVKRHPDFIKMRALWASDGEFRGYLKGKLEGHFGADYTKRLISIFLA